MNTIKVTNQSKLGGTRNQEKPWWTKNEKLGVEKNEHNQNHDNGGLGAPEEDEHDQDHNNDVGTTSDDDHQEEDSDGRRSRAHTWMFRWQRSWWKPLAHHHFACTIHGRINNRFFSIKENKVVTNTMEASLIEIFIYVIKFMISILVIKDKND